MNEGSHNRPNKVAAGHELLVNRLLLVMGSLVVSMGVVWLVPAFAVWTHGRVFEPRDCAVVCVGPVLLFSGVTAVWRGLRAPRGASIPAPVRVVIIANGLVLTFCALEFSDGLIRQGGRVFYWTSVLFPPALVLLAGLVTARRWAWWAARGGSAVFALCFAVFITVLPFADLKTAGEPVPWWGGAYMAGVSLMFFVVSTCAFRALGRAEARTFFGLRIPASVSA